MGEHLRRDLERVKKSIASVGTMVEEATNKAITALVDRRPELAHDVVQSDEAIDEKEVELEEDCLKILALHQPVAGDLRFIITVLKVNNDLERMGDLAINIAERAGYLSTHDPIDVPLDFEKMTESVQKMLRQCLDALIHKDTSLAREVLKGDDQVDAINKEMYTVLQKVMIEDPTTVERAIHTLSASRHLERIADLCTNIAEDVIFLVSGEVVRHHVEDYLKG